MLDITSSTQIRAKDYPAKARYAFFNSTLFNCSLPEISISIQNAKSYAGLVQFRVRRHSRTHKEVVPGSVEMILSSKFLRTVQDFDAIMIHEMIHVHFIVNGDIKEGHGIKFKTKARELGAKVGYPINMYDNPSNLASADQTTKTLFVVIAKRPCGKHYYAIISRAVLAKANLRNNLMEFKQQFKCESLAIFRVYSRGWTSWSHKVPVQRTDRPRFYHENQHTSALIAEVNKFGLLIT